jgi:translation initiation factor 4G
MIALKNMLSSELSIDNFLQYRHNNTLMLDDIVEFYNIVKDVPNNNSNQKQNNNPAARTADTDDEWKRHEARNWLTDNKRNRDDDEKLYSQMRSILNKLSDDNFIVLVEEIKKLNLNDTIHIDKLSEFVFNKALIEPKFCVSYAKLTYEFACYKPYNCNGISFRSLIIKRCQMLFNDLSQVSKDKAKCGMCFIGELYNCDLLPNTIIIFCLNELVNMQLKKQDENTTVAECMLVFVKTIGIKTLKNCNKEIKEFSEKINNIISTVKMSNREKFALMDITDAIKKYEKL